MPPVFRNPDKVQLLPERIWMRYYMPKPKDGFVAEDGDLIIDLFGPRIGCAYNADGRLALIQMKRGANKMGYAQERVYKLMHKLMRKGDPKKRFYRGCYLVNWYVTDVSLDSRVLSLSNDSDLKELETWLQKNPNSVDDAQWWTDCGKRDRGMVEVNGQRFNLEEFKRFLLEELDVPSLFDDPLEKSRPPDDMEWNR